MNLKHRLAIEIDIIELHKLIELSVRFLQKDDYTSAQIDGALGTVLGLDTQLIKDGTYFVVEDANQILGCGGWSYRRTLFGSDNASVRESALLEPSVDAAKIRAFFVHPDFARKGIGSRILALCEDAARQACFKSFEMGATLTGIPLYKARGYVELERLDVPLCNGEFLQVVKMKKNA